MKKLVILFGPPAVGKMTVGYELERLTGLRLFHNHMTIDLVLGFFEFGTPPFQRLVSEFRTRIFSACDIFCSQGAQVYFVELSATLDERLRRNETEFRLAEKRPKRNIEHSRQNLLAAERRYKLNSNGDFFYPERHLHIDNSLLPPDVVAQRIASWMDSLEQSPPSAQRLD